MALIFSKVLFRWTSDIKIICHEAVAQWTMTNNVVAVMLLYPIGSSKEESKLGCSFHLLNLDVRVSSHKQLTVSKQAPLPCFLIPFEIQTTNVQTDIFSCLQLAIASVWWLCNAWREQMITVGLLHYFSSVFKVEDSPSMNVSVPDGTDERES